MGPFPINVSGLNCLCVLIGDLNYSGVIYDAYRF